MTERNSKDGRMAHEGGNAAFHHVDSGNVYGTAEGDRVEGSHAPDVRIRKALGGRARNDDAEKWLRQNDPNYDNSREWNG